MAFLEDPRLRQRWNQITHDAEAATENAAAGIWSFKQNYINPCLGQLSDSIEQCTAVCLGDPEERRRRQLERDREGEYSFDFYDDWYQEEGDGGGSNSGGLFGSFRGEDWDRLLAGTGSQRRHVSGETAEQPKRKRGMSYGTSRARRRNNEDDPTVIPHTHSIGFLSKLPWKIGGTLRYKPSAADLQEHPLKNDYTHGEEEPLLSTGSQAAHVKAPSTRSRSGTTGSGGTSDSYRSRGDLFPSDGEGEEDAIPLDDEITYDMVRKDDRSSGKSRSSKGKRPQFGGSRSVSRTTIGSIVSNDSVQSGLQTTSWQVMPDVESVPSLDDLAEEDRQLQQAEDLEIARRKAAALQLAAEKGFRSSCPVFETKETLDELQDEAPHKTLDVTPLEGEEEIKYSKGSLGEQEWTEGGTDDGLEVGVTTISSRNNDDGFVPARLPHFG